MMVDFCAWCRRRCSAGIARSFSSCRVYQYVPLFWCAPGSCGIKTTGRERCSPYLAVNNLFAPSLASLYPLWSTDIRRLRPGRTRYPDEVSCILSSMLPTRTVCICNAYNTNHETVFECVRCQVIFAPVCLPVVAVGSWCSTVVAEDPEESSSRSPRAWQETHVWRLWVQGAYIDWRRFGEGRRRPSCLAQGVVSILSPLLLSLPASNLIAVTAAVSTVVAARWPSTTRAGGTR